MTMETIIVAKTEACREHTVAPVYTSINGDA